MEGIYGANELDRPLYVQRTCPARVLADIAGSGDSDTANTATLFDLYYFSRIGLSFVVKIAANRLVDLFEGTCNTLINQHGQA